MCRADCTGNGSETTILLPPTNGALEDRVSGMLHLLMCMGEACRGRAGAGPWLAACRKPLLYSLSLSSRCPSVPSPPHDSISQSRAERSTGVGLPTGMERERGSRKPRRYFSPGESRKTSERFRTQPITSAERKESDR